MTVLIWNLVFILIIGIHLKMINAHGNINNFCRLENRTFIFDICQIRPRHTLPVCVGLCSSTTEWNFHLHHFSHQVHSCRVTQHRTEYFICPDATHTAIELMIPLECSCTKRYCRVSHS